MKFNEYYQKNGNSLGDFGIGCAISIGIFMVAGGLFISLADLIKFEEPDIFSLVMLVMVGLVILTGLGIIGFHPRKFIGIGMLTPFVFGMIVFGGCFFMLHPL